MSSEDIKKELKISELSKDKVKRIIDLLFYNLKGTKFIENKDDYKYEDYKLLIDKYELLEDYKDFKFWEEILKKISATFDITPEIRHLLETNFVKFIETLLLKRIEKENFGGFEENLENKEEFKKKIIQKIPEKNLIYFENENKIYALISQEKTAKGRLNIITEKYKLHEYISLFSLGGVISLVGEKPKIKNFKTMMNKVDEDFKEILIKPKNQLLIKNFKLDIKLLLKNLKNKKIFLTGIKYKGNIIKTFVLNSNTVLDIENYFFYNFVFADLNEFLNIEDLSFVSFYDVKENSEKEFSFILKIRKDSDGNNSLYFKIEIFTKSKIKEKAERLKEIKRLLESLGFDSGDSFYYPEDFLFSKLIYGEKMLYYNNLKSMNSKLLKFFEENNLLDLRNENQIFCDKEKILKKIVEVLKNKKNITHTIGNSKIEIEKIEKIEKKSSRIILYFKVSKDNLESFQKIILPLKGMRLRKYDRIHSIIFEEINFNKVFSDDAETFFRYFFNEIEKYKIHKYNIFLEKEGINAYRFLKNKLEAPNRSAELGKQVEENLNILLKYMFGNFLPLGGKYEPDGQIILNQGGSKNISYVIDSKMNENIDKDQYTKLREYIKKYGDNNTYNLELKGGIFFISEKWTENSLNETEIKKDENRKIFHISVELILRYFEIFQENKSLILSNNEILKKISKKIFEKKDDNSIVDIQKLKDFEEEKLSFIEKTIWGKSVYLPEKRKNL